MVTPPTNQTIAARVREAMAAADESEQSVAEATGIARTTLRRRLTGNSAFTTDELVPVSRHLGLPLMHFLADEEQVSA